MAFKNYTTQNAGTSPVTVHTVSAGKEAIVIGCNLANVSPSMVYVTVEVAGVNLVKNAPIPANSALGVLDGKIVMEAAQTLVVTSDTAASVDVILSVLEQDVS